MADRFELVAIALPCTSAPESLAPDIANFIAMCWSGMSRAQLFERARRIGLHVSLRRLPDRAVDGVQRYALRLASKDGGKREEVGSELVAYVRRIVRRHGARRAKASLPPARDTRQGGLF
ncbi:hypothetical protein [Paraburkholderia bannensis]|uniref:hypothetical protein n=1 Tax=Paraburkholderia bannensis TaxID=765414 RepID=UPI002AB6980A|nr:hypothetical protein [Paraburkholderia bannensis]